MLRTGNQVQRTANNVPFPQQPMADLAWLARCMDSCKSVGRSLRSPHSPAYRKTCSFRRSRTSRNRRQRRHTPSHRPAREKAVPKQSRQLINVQNAL